MKKLQSLLLLGFLMILAACSNDELIAPDAPTGQTITVNIPGAESRAIADYGKGSNINRCILEIYHGGKRYDRKVVGVTAGKATFSDLRLVASQEYDFVFWADCANADLTDKAYVTENILKRGLGMMNAKDYKGNNDEFDAFYKKETFTVTEAFSKDIFLTRPFGQLTVRTLDMGQIMKDELKPDRVEVKFTSVPKNYNLVEDKPITSTELVYTANLLDAATGEISVDYIFATDEEAALADFQITFMKGDKILLTNTDFKNIPIRRNYRTNITGNLLTKQGSFTVEVNPEFATPDRDVNVWSGEYVEDATEENPKTPLGFVVDAANNTITIKDAESLAYLHTYDFAWGENNQNQEQWTVKLDADVDLNNKTWEPITFKYGTFDGQGHAIYNLNINSGASLSRATAGGTAMFLAGTEEGFSPRMVQNLDIVNAKVIGGAMTGVVWDCNGNVKNVNVRNIDVQGVNCVGGIIGQANGSNIESCSVTGTGNKVTATEKEAGGICGFMTTGDAKTTLSIKDCGVENITVTAPTEIGGIVAHVYCGTAANVQITNPTVGNVTLNATGSGETYSDPVMGYNENNSTRVKVTGITRIIYTVDEFKAFAAAVTEKNNHAGEIIKLGADLDLKNEPWNPINHLSGTFDGDGHTIYNLKVDVRDNGIKEYATGLFGSTNNRIMNLTIDGAEVYGYHDTAILVGYHYGSIENCHVKNAVVDCQYKDSDDSGDKAGTIAGFLGEDADCINCTAMDCTVKACRDAGQILGAAYPNRPNSTVEGCKAINVVVMKSSVYGGIGAGSNLRNDIIGRIVE